MKRFLLTLFLILLLSLSVSAEKSISFSDLPESHWAYPTVMPMVEKGLFNGTSEIVDGVGTFSPDKAMTRGEFIAVICREYFKDEIYTPSPDLPWWDPYFTIAVKHEIINYQTDFVDLGVVMTRGEAALIIERTMSAIGEPLRLTRYNYIYDYDAVKKYEEELYRKGNVSALIRPINQCIRDGLIGGIDSNGTFDPYGVLTRAAAATIICRTYDKSMRVEVGLPCYLREEVQAQLEECAKGNHYFTGEEDEITYSGKLAYEEIKRATYEEEGIYRINCMYCDYYVERPFRKHSCYTDYDSNNDFTLTCGDNYWHGGACEAGTYTGLIDSKMLEQGYSIDSAELVIHCRGEAHRSRLGMTSREAATHDFAGFKIVSLPGIGVEGMMENICKKCGRREFKILPMYSTPGMALDVRDSYVMYNVGSACMYGDAYIRDIQRVRYDKNKSLGENTDMLSDYFYATENRFLSSNHGIIAPYGGPTQPTLGGAIGRLIENPRGEGLGLHIFSWKREEGFVATFFYEQMGMELIYFFTGDREVSYALCQVIDSLYVYGSEATTAEKIASFGFKVYNETATSIELEMKNTHILWEWGEDIVGNHFYFSNIK